MANNPEARLPLDTTVQLPPGVAAAAAAAEAAHKAAYGEQPTPQPNPTPQPITPQPDPAPAPAPAPVPAPAPAAPPLQASTPEERAGVDPASDRGQFYAMEGRYKKSQATIGELQQQMSELADELGRATQTIQSLRSGADPAPQQRQQRPQPVRQHLTEDDVKTYGPELLETIQRAARDAVAPDLQQVQQQTRQTNQRVMSEAQRQVYATLDREVPTWREINENIRFKAWARLPDVYSGVVRGKLLQDAFQAANAPRVAQFFKGFLAEEVATGQLSDLGSEPPAPAPVPRQAAVQLDTLTAPGRAKPASGDQPHNAADKPLITRAQITQFYRSVREGKYAGRDDDRRRDEAMIYAAQAEQRIR